MKSIKLAILLLVSSSQLAFAKVADRKIDEKISVLLDEGRKINLLVIPGKITNAFHVSEDWFEGIKSNVTNATSARMVRKFSSHQNFNLIDRASIDDLLKEIHFQSTGLVSKETALEIGKMTGASYMVVIDVSRFQENDGFIDYITQKLIEIETAQIIAISSDKLDEKGRVLKMNN